MSYWKREAEKARKDKDELFTKCKNLESRLKYIEARIDEGDKKMVLADRGFNIRLKKEQPTIGVPVLAVFAVVSEYYECGTQSACRTIEEIFIEKWSKDEYCRGELLAFKEICKPCAGKK